MILLSVLLIIKFRPLLPFLLAMQGPTNSLHEWTNSTFSNSKFEVKDLLKIHCTFSIDNTLVGQNTFILRKVEFRVSDMQLCENIRDRQ